MKKTLLLSILFFTVSFCSFGQDFTDSTPGNSKTWTVPAGITSITVECWGAGGGGGGARTYAAAGGGTGGAYTRKTFTGLVPGTTYQYTVGQGGAGGTNSGGNGATGGTSWFNTSAILRAVGGTGGEGVINFDSGNGGAAVTSGNVTAADITNFYGGRGSNGNVGNTRSGAGGSSAGSASNGNPGVNATGGTAVTDGGAGGNGVNSNIASDNGDNPGGGGGGAGYTNTGGRGGNGKIAITYNCPTSAGTLSGTQSICTYGTTSTTFSSTVGGGTWSSSNTSVATVNSSTGVVTSGGTIGMATITYTISSASCTTQTATRIVYVNNGPGAAPATLTGSSTQCQGTSTSYTASAVQGSYAYTWSYGGSGATITPSADGLSATVAFSATATSGNLKITSTNACGTDNGGKSIYVTVNPIITATPVANNASNIQCSYAQLNYSSVANAVGLYLDIATDNAFTNFVPGYNNFNVTYSNGSYPASNLPAGTLYYRVRAYNGCTTTANSNTISFSTSSPVGGTVSSTQTTICSGANPSNLTLSGNTGTIARWEKSTDAAFTSPTTINATTATLTGATIGALTANTYFRAVLTGSNCTSYSSSLLINVSGGGTIDSAQTICTGSSPASLTVKGYTGSITRWEKSSTSTFAPATTTAINVTTATLSSASIGALTANTYFRAVVNTGTCGTANSEVVLITVAALPQGGITANGPFCATGSGQLTFTATAGSGPFTIVYNDGTANRTVTNVNSGSAFATFTPTVTNTTTYNLVSVANATCTRSTGFTGNTSATITVNANKPASVTLASNQSGSICQGTQVTFTATAVNGGANPTYQWYNGTNLISGQNGATYTTNQLTSSDAIKVVMTSNATPCLTGSPATSNSITTTVITTDRGVTRGGKHICLGSATPTLTLYSYDLNNTVYQDATKVVKWQYSDDAGNTTWYDIPNTSSAVTYSPPEILSAFRTYRAVVKNGSCDAKNAIETRVDVDPLPTPTFTASAGAISCVGTDITYTTQTLQNNYVWTVSGTVTNDYRIISGGLGGNSSTVTLRWLTTGNKTVTINYKNSNGCTAAVATSSTTDVRATPPAPVTGTINPATCTTNGSVTLTGLPTGTWTLTQTGTFPNSITDTGSTYTVTNLAAGTYTFTVSNGSCTSLPLSNVQIADQSTATWNGTSWAGGITPNATKNVIFTGAYTITSNLEACSCTINSGVNVSVATGITLKITNAVNVATGATLTFEDSSSLVQVNDASVNTGKITYKRITKQIRQADFTYWSTPVSPQKLIDVSEGTQYNMYMGFTGTNWLVTDRSTDMVVGKGYIIRGPQNYSNTAKADYEASFKGVPNNGIISGESLLGGKYYLIGNPYPSAIRASKFLAANLFMNGTLYFWTHNTPVVLSGAYQYKTSDYASYNLTGGTSTAPAQSGNSGNNNNTPLGYIAAGQSFFASAASDGTIQFNNDMREGGTHNGQFFKPGKTAKETDTDTDTDGHHIWLNLTNDGGAFKQMLVGYVDGATNDFDKNYDGKTFDGNMYVDFYSVNDQKKYAIQGRALPFEDTDIVPLGYRTTIAGDFTISIDQADGDLATHAVYIEDKTTGAVHDLKAGKFTFTTAAGTFTDRLVLRYTNKTLGTGDFENTENDLIVSVKDKVIKVNSAKENIKEISIFDITGKTLYTKNKIETTEFQISNLQSGNQVLFIKVTLENGFIASKKIIFN
ncbi:T9SS sorting signal type C domain-containing protein [Flavobacterium sp. HTF]|uniref:T9SS sorting signal type C domain-containing protein n=1 Tax=Flavobacterium sp. HTF TaxID=2170732 RepID=UPI000D5EED50|nr:T9SS sorting signal type C domain-containing protein [Flavobacterium sp. HTF]PWB22195.1 hypothetical protein DCO46_17805 [Flavobacterium sp. HTF]